MIGTEILPEKAEVARANFAEAGVSELVDLRVGDARETLKDCGGPLDLVLLDGWKDIELDVLRILVPQLRPGALVFTDNIFTFEADNRGQREFMADPRNGFRAMVLPLKDGMEMAVYTPDSAEESARYAAAPQAATIARAKSAPHTSCRNRPGGRAHSAAAATPRSPPATRPKACAQMSVRSPPGPSMPSSARAAAITTQAG